MYLVYEYREVEDYSSSYYRLPRRDWVLIGMAREMFELPKGNKFKFETRYEITNAEDLEEVLTYRLGVSKSEGHPYNLKQEYIPRYEWKGWRRIHEDTSRWVVRSETKEEAWEIMNKILKENGIEL